jgi:hypothetical protein
MAIHHELDLSGRANLQGESAESLFADLAKKHGFKVTPANSYQERIEHWDFLLTKEKNLRVEVKSLKTFAVLHNGRMTRNYLLVEFAGVSGQRGWVYGKADFIAYELKDYFLLVSREYLLAVACKKCSAEWVDKREEMLYRNYGRKDRLDQVSAILISDIEDKNKFCLWKKN